MRYDYSGYIKSLLFAPDSKIRDGLAHVEFGPADFEQWSLFDDDNDPEWKNIPAYRERTEEAILLRGQFESTSGIDNLDVHDPRYWVALSCMNWKDARLPVDVQRFPIVELTYRCRTSNARPAWLLHYPGGFHFDGLVPTMEWRTIARKIPHFGFPRTIDHISLRLYGVTRTTESIEVKSIRFREMSPGEHEALEKHARLLDNQGGPKEYPLMKKFMPLGVFMKAGAGKRLAEMMEMSFRDYWRFALEDIARHHHNSIALEEMGSLTPTEWQEILGLAASYGIRILAIHDWSPEHFEAHGRSLVHEYIEPYADSQAILGWSIHHNPKDNMFNTHLQARKLIEEVDPNHPLVVMMQDPNAFPLFSPYFAATGITHNKSRAAWEIGSLTRSHFPLSRGQNFWLSVPTHVHATDTPEWSTCPEIRLMINLAMAQGVKGWFANSYHNEPVWLRGSVQRTLTGPFLTFSDLWAELSHRMERFNAMAPLFLNANPVRDCELQFEFTWEEHPNSKRPNDVPPLEWQWMEGPDFHVLYVITNDIREMTSVNIRVPANFPDDLAIYDITDFVRNRNWLPMSRQRHLEMFPGQGEVILAGKPKVCEHMRDLMIEHIMENDRRQVAFNLGLARRYNLNIRPVQDLTKLVGMSSPLEDLVRMHEVRDLLLNLIYQSPPLMEPRSKLIQASAAACGCDGTLCRLYGKGRKDEAFEFGQQLLPLTREMNRLFVRLRKGDGVRIYDECNRLARNTLELLAEIRGAIKT